MKLTIELVPRSSWYTNVRSQVSKAQWDVLRKRQATLAGHQCEVCQDSGLHQGYKWPVECHEIWDYNDDTHTQTLNGLISLCPRCHKVKHAGRTIYVEHDLVLVVNQLMKVNSMSEDQVHDYVLKSLEQWKSRSQFDWTVDVSLLDNFSMKL
jgi:hypothetical protein